MTIEQTSRSITPINTESADISRGTKFSDVKNDFLRLAEKPHGGDKKLGAFYKAAHGLANTNAQFQDFLHTALEKRDTEINHFANLFLRSIQYIEIFEKGRTEYDNSFTDPSAWEELLIGKSGTITEHGDQLQELLESRETTTSKYQRYAGIKAALNVTFSGKPLKIADFGCGANYGLRGFAGDIPFEDEIQVDDLNKKNQNEKIAALLGAKVVVDEKLGVDKNRPTGEEEFKWRLACSFYPGELNDDAIQNMKALEKQMTKVAEAEEDFIHGDLLELEINHADGTLPEGRFDAVILSTILYQMTDTERAKLISSAKKTINDKGVIIVQDFAKKDATNPNGLNFDIDWGEQFSYRTFILNKDSEDWQEFLQWNNGRCRGVKVGADFDKVVAIPHSKNVQQHALFDVFNQKTT